MTYFDKLAELRPCVVEELEKRKIEARYLGFGGPGDPPIRKPSVPTDARSEFLANRAMGDWAENLLAESLRNAFPALDVVHYGDSDRMAAGEAGFKDFYLSRLEDVRVHGKRPDLLVTKQNSGLLRDVSYQKTADILPLVRCANLSIEVRSSKFEALRYMRVRADRKAAGERGVRETPSFTVKVEDLKIVYRWIEQHGIDQIYCQVFFDSVFAINILRIFEIIGSGGKGFKIETPAKSQEKATIFIPITSGIQVGSFTDQPTFEVEHKMTELGRHDVYVLPKGGHILINSAAFREACMAPGTLG